MGQSHAAEAGAGRAGAPAGFGELAIGLGETRCLLHLSFNNPWRIGFAGAVERSKHAFREPGGFFQDGGNEVRAGFLKWRTSADFVNSRQFSQEELHFP